MQEEHLVGHYARFNFDAYPRRIEWWVNDNGSIVSRVWEGQKVTTGVSVDNLDLSESSKQQALKDILLYELKNNPQYKEWVKHNNRRVSASSAYEYVASWYGEYPEYWEHLSPTTVFKVVEYSDNAGEMSVPGTLSELSEHYSGFSNNHYPVPKFSETDYDLIGADHTEYEKLYTWWNDPCNDGYWAADPFSTPVKRDKNIVLATPTYMVGDTDFDEVFQDNAFEYHIAPTPLTYSYVRQYIDYVLRKRFGGRLISMRVLPDVPNLL